MKLQQNFSKLLPEDLRELVAGLALGSSYVRAPQVCAPSVHERAKGRHGGRQQNQNQPFVGCSGVMQRSGWREKPCSKKCRTSSSQHNVLRPLPGGVLGSSPWTANHPFQRGFTSAAIQAESARLLLYCPTKIIHAQN